MKEIKNKTIYTPDNVKKFLEVYYFEKVKVPRLIINIFISETLGSLIPLKTTGLRGYKEKEKLFLSLN